MSNTTAGRKEEDGDEMAKMLAQVFPQNPEMTELAWEEERDGGVRNEDPLIAANPAATMTPSDNDNGQALPPLYLDGPMLDAQAQERWMKSAPWDCLDEATLRGLLMRPMEGSLGGRCCRHLDHWQETCGGHEMMNVGMWTYCVDPVESPRRLRSEKRMQEKPVKEEERSAYRQLLQDEINAGIVMEIPFEEAGYISPSFAVKKKPGPDGKKKWRKVWDGRRVNAEQITIHFRMDSPETVQQVALPGDRATSIDLKNAFNHLRLHADMQPFLCFAFEGHCYKYVAMPFGAKHSPRLFTQALGYAVKFIRTHWRTRLVAYIDDMLLLHQDPSYLRLATLQIAVYLRYLGWTLSIDKCEFTPSPTIRFLGWLWCCDTRTLRMTTERCSALSRRRCGWCECARGCVASGLAD
jgi:hypothetical protein